MIQFYGSPMSSAGRSHWMLEETGVPYEYHRVSLRDPAQAADFKKINPGGRIPFLVDGDLRLPESMAINFYLAEKYAPAMWGHDVEERARILSWSLWAGTNLQTPTMTVLMHTMFLPAEKRHPEAVEPAKAQIHGLLDLLEAQFPSSGFLVGGRYTVADINVASCVHMTTAVGAALGPKTTAWLTALKARPQFVKALAG